MHSHGILIWFFLVNIWVALLSMFPKLELLLESYLSIANEYLNQFLLGMIRAFSKSALRTIRLGDGKTIFMATGNPLTAGQT